LYQGTASAVLNEAKKDPNAMSEPQIRKQNVGRIAERIVANELEYRGFLVRDLNLEGLAANVDLLAGKNEKLWQIQVKGSTYDNAYPDNGWWFQYGHCEEEHIQSSNLKFFNRHPGAFRADIVVLVCVRTPHAYQCLVLPAEIAEEAAQLNLNLFRAKKADGSDHKPGKVWLCLYQTKARNAYRQDLLDRERELVKPYMDKWDFDLTVVGQQVEQAEEQGARVADRNDL
jgi:hypothetical protein